LRRSWFCLACLDKFPANQYNLCSILIVQNRFVVDDSENEIQLKKYQARMSLWRTCIFASLAFAVVAIAAATVSFYIASTEARLEIELAQSKALQNAQIKQLESEDHYVKIFMDRILRTGNRSQELRYAKYFSIVSATEDQRSRWTKYYDYLVTKKVSPPGRIKTAR